jgi:hypothetical protein
MCQNIYKPLIGSRAPIVVPQRIYYDKNILTQEFSWIHSYRLPLKEKRLANL